MSVPVILVIRLSAMGDVALTLPVIRSAAENGKRVVVVTKSPFTPFFKNIPGLEVFAADTRGRHSGLVGIVTLFREIRSMYTIDRVIDLHDVLRSKVLRFLFRVTGHHLSVIEKGRREKRRFIRLKREPHMVHTIDRYTRTFVKADSFSGNTYLQPFIISSDEQIMVDEIFGVLVTGSAKLIAIAPFSKHKTKSWGTDRVEELIDLLSNLPETHFFLFGGQEDREELERMAGSGKRIEIVAGKYDLRTELALLSRIDLMISMDSSNMHLAALSGVKTVSIWGGTHPSTGFSPTGAQQHLIIQVPIEKLDCRPCTIYGKGECTRTDLKFKCLKDITAADVFNEILSSGILES